MQILSPLSFHEKGKRPRNEDNIYPKTGQATDKNTVFLVCDGVGGAVSGDIASRMVSDAFGLAFETKKADAKSLQATLSDVQKQIDNYLLGNPDSKGMGTTLTFLQLFTVTPERDDDKSVKGGAIIAHAGDSRVYHIRGNRILFCTYDHSLINELKKQGMHEEAERAKSNIITRALQGNSVKKIELDTHTITDIQANDYFLLCSDGVWGAISDEDLLDILQKKTTNAEKLNEIEQLCEQFSKDNYSAYLLQIEKVEKPVPTTFTKPVTEEPTTRVFVESTQKARKAAWVAPFLITSAIAGIGFYAWYNWSKVPKKPDLTTTTTSPSLDNDTLNLAITSPPPSVSAPKKGEKEERKTVKKEPEKGSKSAEVTEKKAKKEVKTSKDSTVALKTKPLVVDTTKKKTPIIEPTPKNTEEKVDTSQNKP
jgi:PPM family protein phosphatase